MATKAMKRTTGSKAKRSSAMKTKANVAMTSMKAMKRTVRNASKVPSDEHIVASAMITKKNKLMCDAKGKSKNPMMYETWIRINYKNTPLMRIKLMHKEKKPLGWKVFAEADRWESP